MDGTACSSLKHVFLLNLTKKRPNRWRRCVDVPAATAPFPVSSKKVQKTSAGLHPSAGGLEDGLGLGNSGAEGRGLGVGTTASGLQANTRHANKSKISRTTKALALP